MAIFDFSSTNNNAESYCTPSLRYKFDYGFIENAFKTISFMGKPINNTSLSEDTYIPFNPLPYNTIRGYAWGPRTPHRLQIYGRGGGKIPVDLTNYFYTPRTYDNKLFVSTTYNNLPIRGWVYVPTEITSDLDVVVLYHGTITTDGITPYEASERFLNLAITKDRLNLRDKIVFSVAYPQDTIPSWNTPSIAINQSRAEFQFPGIQIDNFYLGDNLAYAEAALLWSKNSLDSYLSSNGFSVTIGKTYTFGHSQGAGLVHKLNTLYTVDGAIMNAPGQIDVFTTCSISEKNDDSIFSCKKLKSGFFSTEIEPDKYNSISLKNYLTGLKSPSLYLQALNDTTGNDTGAPQVYSMQNILQAGLNNCIDCAPFTFKYYASGGHECFAYVGEVQQDIRAFVGSGA